MIHVRKYQKLILLFVICLFLAVTLTACSLAKKFGIGFSSSKSEHSGSASIHFTQSKDEILKEIDLDDNIEELALHYTEFELEEGSFVFQLCIDSEVVAVNSVAAGESASGTIQFIDLDKNLNYTLKIIAEDALDGNIEIEFE